jgi:hypothetical protein
MRWARQAEPPAANQASFRYLGMAVRKPSGFNSMVHTTHKFNPAFQTCDVLCLSPGMLGGVFWEGMGGSIRNRVHQVSHARFKLLKGAPLNGPERADCVVASALTQQIQLWAVIALGLSATTGQEDIWREAQMW